MGEYLGDLTDESIHTISSKIVFVHPTPFVMIFETSIIINLTARIKQYLVIVTEYKHGAVILQQALINAKMSISNLNE